MSRILLRLSLALGLTMVGLCQVTLPARAQAAGAYVITDVVASAFPQVGFKLRALDASNKVITGLNPGNLPIFENGQLVPAQNVQITPKDDGPMTFIFVIDYGVNNNYLAVANPLRTALGTLTERNIFVDGRDRVQVLSRENVSGDRTEVVVNPTTRRDDYGQWVGRETFATRSRAPTKGLEAVQDAIRSAAGFVPVPGSQPVAIVFVSRGVEDPAPQVAAAAARNYAGDARAKGMTIIAIQTDGFTPKEPLQTLAGVSNGAYIQLGPNIGTDAENAYRAVSAQRTYYQVTYTSAVGTPGNRRITVNAADQPVQGTATYAVSPLPASVTIDTPATGNELRREPTTNANGESTYPPLRPQVVASYKFADGFTRTVETAQLLVDGRVTSAVPKITPGRVEFVGDLSDAATTAVNKKPLRLEVRIKDSLGVENVGRSDLFVTVIAPPTPVPTVAPSPTPQGVTLTTGAAAGVGGAVLVLGLLAGAAVIIMRRRGQRQDAPKTMIYAPGKAVTYGSLTVLAGPRELINYPLKLTLAKTVIGRSPQGTDLQFFANQESSISRAHCTIEAIDGRSFITDSSSSGTFLNGRRIPQGQQIDLHEGDELILGDLTRKGVKLRFSTASSDLLSGSDSTRYVNRD